MSMFPNANGAEVMSAICAEIVKNKAYLSEIDGKIGDGDHGVNMAKGFNRCSERLTSNETLDQAMTMLSDILLTEIGGSMGPLYGSMFMDMADEIDGNDQIDPALFGKMLEAAVVSITDMGAAKVGDKTILDTLVPATQTFKDAITEGKSFQQALELMETAAAHGRDSTIDLVAKVGRAARLGERSKGVLDAGATSCCIILTILAQGVSAKLVD